MMADGDNMRARLILIDFNVVDDAVGGENAHHAARRQAAVGAQPIQHGVGVGEQALRLLAHHLILRDTWVFACQRPVIKKGVQSI